MKNYANQHLLDDYAPHIMRKCIAQAMEGNPAHCWS